MATRVSSVTLPRLLSVLDCPSPQLSERKISKATPTFTKACVTAIAKSCREMASGTTRGTQSAEKKEKSLTIEEKLDVCKLIATGTSYTVISERYGIGGIE